MTTLRCGQADLMITLLEREGGSRSERLLLDLLVAQVATGGRNLGLRPTAATDTEATGAAGTIVVPVIAGRGLVVEVLLATTTAGPPDLRVLDLVLVTELDQVAVAEGEVRPHLHGRLAHEAREPLDDAGALPLEAQEERIALAHVAAVPRDLARVSRDVEPQPTRLVRAELATLVDVLDRQPHELRGGHDDRTLDDPLAGEGEGLGRRARADRRVRVPHDDLGAHGSLEDELAHVLLLRDLADDIRIEELGLVGGAPRDDREEADDDETIALHGF